MGFEDRSVPEFKIFTAGLRLFSAKILDETVGLDEQSPTRWGQFFQRVCDEFPFVKQYEDAWPVEVYMYKWLGGTSWQYKKRKREEGREANRESRRRRLDSTTESAANVEDTDQPAPPTMSHLSQSVRTAREPLLPLPRHKPAPVSPSSTDGSQKGGIHCPESTATLSVTRPVVPNEEPVTLKSGPEPRTYSEVECFLRSLEPRLEGLVPNLVNAGIVDDACITTLARLPDVEKDLLLKNDVRLNALQLRIVRVALARKVALLDSGLLASTMGSSQSIVSGTGIAAVLAAGAVAVAYNYTTSHHADSQAPAPPPPSSSKSDKKKKKQGSADASPAQPQPAAANPTVVPFPQVVPGDFDAPSEARDSEQPARPKASKAKKKKAKKAGTPGPATPRPAPDDSLSESSATAPESRHAPAQARPTPSKTRKGSTPKPQPQDTDGSWTRVDSKKRTPAQQQQQPPAGTTASDAGVTTTSLTGTSSPTAGMTESEASVGPSAETSSAPENRRTLAEKLLPKPRKTGVDDMLETPDYPTLSRVMRIQPGPNDKPAAGFSWGDYEDVDDPRATADDADGEDDGGWGVVKGRSRSKAQKQTPEAQNQTPETQKHTHETQSAPDAMTKKQRQNAAKREAAKTAKAEAEADRQVRLAKHKRELERAKIAEQYSRPSRATSGGMTAYVDENGNLVWK
ncbi:hypothetical protein WOLCODRAFT_166799 [Wolfiporia cocos MD-104 SS10]|uniref:Uncharacterized protein n=1 Tax=Wolfiporia cocos (strain MD-104) TaxID=742152 RepID=A0A2H3JC09_WOLCO|nr:hypothetical protein WOLCODRAFT_166799 [Wolfiporia cocos MD-104 SS10]